MDLAERGPSSRRHPWELARAEFFLRLLETHGLLSGDGDWLDAGAGDAWFASLLRRRVPQQAAITCWDVNYSTEDVDALEGLALPNVNYVAQRPTKEFDRILMLDVLEHVDDDAGFVSDAVRDLMRECGYLLVSVPAYPRLWSSHDRLSRHRRRYSPDECRRLLEHSGLAVIASGGLFCSLLPVRLARTLLDRLAHSTPRASWVGSWGGGRVVTAILTRALITDGRLSIALSERGHELPGLSFWALARIGSK